MVARGSVPASVVQSVHAATPVMPNSTAPLDQARDFRGTVHEPETDR
jgi:hypothetical protein